MKTIYCCPYCGSSKVFEDAWSAMNWNEVPTYDHKWCMNCDQEVSDTIAVEVDDGLLDCEVKAYVHYLEEEVNDAHD